MHVRLFALLAVLAVGPALGQVMLPAAPPVPAPPPGQIQMRPQIARPLPAPAPADSSAATLQPWMDPDRAKAAIEKLQADKHKLREQYRITLSEYQKTLAELDEMTRVGGSRVTAHCDGLVSVTTAGASENCGASGYACNAVSGLCERSCHQDSGTKCAPGYLCDETDHCALPPEAS
jgi:hypothetical protein